MAYVINGLCAGEKSAECVAVCPVDCIHPTPDEEGFADSVQLYINPDDCIDCYACMEVCPVSAITPADLIPQEWQSFIEINAAYFRDKAS